MVGRALLALTKGRLQWSSLGDVYDEFIFPGGFTIGFPDSREKFREALIDAFPTEHHAVDDYFREVKEVAGAMRGYYAARALPPWLGGVASPLLARKAQQHFSKTTAEVMGRLTSNERLRTVMTAQWAYYGRPPSTSSWASHALVAKHFFYGGYYPVGGSQSIAEHMLRPVIDAGGAVRIKADVSEILVRRGRAVGVRLRDGEEISAGRVISAAGALQTITRLLPEPYRARDWSTGIQQLESTPAHVCVYLGMKGDIRQTGAGSANKWFYETWDHELKGWDARAGDRAPVLYTSFPSLKDPTHDPGPDQLHTGEVVTFLPLSDFARWDGTRWMKRGPDYEEYKAELTERLTEQLLEYMPGLRPMIVHKELSTPLSTVHFTRSAGGAIYGLEPTPRRFANPWLRPRLPLGGLYLAGVDVAMPGVIGAMVGGALAALAAEPRRALPFFARLS
jgi:all-trans-retinol 13,14-reductase